MGIVWTFYLRSIHVLCPGGKEVLKELIFLKINTRKSVSLIDPACNAGFEQLILNLSISTSTLFEKHFIIFLDDCEKDDKNDFECEMELMQELKRHENVIQLLGICKSMYQLHNFIWRPNL